jgi:hypothetical protein
VPRVKTYRVAGPDAEPGGELAAEQQIVAAEFLQRARCDMAGEQRFRLDVGEAHAAHHDARRAALDRGEHLAFDQRMDGDDARHLLHAIGERREIGNRALRRIDAEMAVEPEDAVEQLDAEAVHHRHHDDQRRDAEHDADEREDGDDRDEAFLATGAQIAERDHPLEGVEDHHLPPRSVSAASGESSCRWPPARILSSITPLSSPRGPTTSW